jgi:O-antigen/teichoic acid export membrane protein
MLSLNNKIISNSLWLYLSEIVNKLLMFFFIVYLARKLGPEFFGIYTFVISFILAFMVFINFGMNTIFIRDASADKNKINEYYSSILYFKLFSSIVFLIIILGIASLFADKQSFIVVLLFSIYFLISNFVELQIGLFRIFEEMKYESIIRIIERSFLTISGIIALFLGFGLFTIAVIYITSGIISLALAYIASKKYHLQLTPLTFNSILSIKQIARQSTSYALFDVFFDIYSRIDVLILTFMLGTIAAGLYGAIIRFTDLLIFIPIVLMRTVTPFIASSYGEKNNNYKNIFQDCIKLLSIIIIPICIFIFFFSLDLLQLLYTNEYFAVKTALSVLMVAFIFIFLNRANLYFLNTTFKEKTTRWLILFMIPLNLLLNIILIPKYSILGVTISLLLTEIIIFIATVALIRKYFSFFVIKTYFLPLFFASIISAAFLKYFAQQFLNFNQIINIIIILVAYILICLFLLYLFRVITAEEIRQIKSLTKIIKI